MMEALNERLSTHSINAHYRLAHLLADLGQRYQIHAAIGDPVSDRMARWLQSRYPSRMGLESPGGVVLVGLSGRLRKLALPLSPAAFEFTLDPGLRPSALPVNILCWVEGIGLQEAQALTEDARREIASDFELGLRAFAVILRVKRSLTYVPESLLALKRGALCATTARPNYGEASWALMEAVELLLKAFLSARAFQPKDIKDLKRLARQGEASGLEPIEDGILDRLQLIAMARDMPEYCRPQEFLRTYRITLEALAKVSAQMPLWREATAF